MPTVCAFEVFAFGLTLVCEVHPTNARTTRVMNESLAFVVKIFILDSALGRQGENDMECMQFCFANQSAMLKNSREFGCPVFAPHKACSHFLFEK